MARLIDVNKVIDSMQECLDEYQDEKHSIAYFAFEKIIECLKQEPTVDAVPVSELKKLRDYLYAEDLIFMRGLAELNKLIAKYGAKMDGSSNEE